MDERVRQQTLCLSFCRPEGRLAVPAGWDRLSPENGGEEGARRRESASRANQAGSPEREILSGRSLVLHRKSLSRAPVGI
jgi:hypothetical protein